MEKWKNELNKQKNKQTTVWKDVLALEVKL